jgi:hypothetical protein
VRDGVKPGLEGRKRGERRCRLVRTRTATRTLFTNRTLLVICVPILFIKSQKSTIGPIAIIGQFINVILSFAGKNLQFQLLTF